MSKNFFITASFTLISFDSAHAMFDAKTHLYCSALKCGAFNISQKTLERCIKAHEDVIESNPNCANAFLKNHCRNNSDVYKEECSTIARVISLHPTPVEVLENIPFENHLKGLQDQNMDAFNRYQDIMSYEDKYPVEVGNSNSVGVVNPNTSEARKIIRKYTAIKYLSKNPYKEKEDIQGTIHRRNTNKQ